MNIESLLFWIALIVFLLGILRIKKAANKHGYSATPYLNTKAEQNFYNQLVRKLPSEVTVCCKVRLADLCYPTNRKNISAFNQISRKHIDFVLIEQVSSKVICAIELDDRSHNSKSAQHRDSVKNYALKSAGINLIRVKASKSYRKPIDAIVESLEVNMCKKTEKLNEHNQNCPVCSSTEYELIEMKGWNKGKSYNLCSKCGHSTEPAKLA
ncbi:hypothetical protein VA249_45550 (plasmid) [Vibrio alfacsensis]|uniref:DUF2726 domain-containing protein n=1 Tax=Vibrio alfacsensis TaxID=1074311 RepID=UPI001BEEBA9E|nr:DUF2726 domain-containing protein [Vibrio alfacsensis]BBM67909.1 hypothetical protein VA249_45550 [Vibrio alfacsensis]